jgi:hypothetical protein
MLANLLTRSFFYIQAMGCPLRELHHVFWLSWKPALFADEISKNKNESYAFVILDIGMQLIVLVIFFL